MFITASVSGKRTAGGYDRKLLRVRSIRSEQLCDKVSPRKFKELCFRVVLDPFWLTAEESGCVRRAPRYRQMPLHRPHKGSNWQVS